MTVKQSDIIRAFQDVQAKFPFLGYIDNKVGKYIIIISQIMKEYPPKSRVLSIGAGPSDLACCEKQS